MNNELTIYLSLLERNLRAYNSDKAALYGVGPWSK